MVSSTNWNWIVNTFQSVLSSQYLELLMFSMKEMILKAIFVVILHLTSLMQSQWKYTTVP